MYSTVLKQKLLLMAELKTFHLNLSFAAFEVCKWLKWLCLGRILSSLISKYGSLQNTIAVKTLPDHEKIVKVPILVQSEDQEPLFCVSNINGSVWIMPENIGLRIESFQQFHISL